MTSREAVSAWVRTFDDRRLVALSQGLLIIRTGDDLIFVWASEGDRQHGSRRESQIRKYLLDYQEESVEYQFKNDIVPKVSEPLSLGGRITKWEEQ